MYNFVLCRSILSQIFLYIAHGFPEIIPFPVANSLKALRNKSLDQSIKTYKVYMLLFWKGKIFGRLPIENKPNKDIFFAQSINHSLFLECITHL